MADDTRHKYQDLPTHWMSYSSSPENLQGFGNAAVQISIVLDFGAHHMFSGVPIVIFYQETAGLNNAVRQNIAAYVCLILYVYYFLRVTTCTLFKLYFRWMLMLPDKRKALYVRKNRP